MQITETVKTVIRDSYLTDQLTYKKTIHGIRIIFDYRTGLSISHASSKKYHYRNFSLSLYDNETGRDIDTSKIADQPITLETFHDYLFVIKTSRALPSKPDTEIFEEYRFVLAYRPIKCDDPLSQD